MRRSSLDGGVHVLELDGSLGVLREELLAVAAPRRVEFHHGVLVVDELLEVVLVEDGHRAAFRLNEGGRRGPLGSRRGRGRFLSVLRGCVG